VHTAGSSVKPGDVELEVELAAGVCEEQGDRGGEEDPESNFDDIDPQHPSPADAAKLELCGTIQADKEPDENSDSEFDFEF
jgi:hypothetical protein